MNKQNKSTKTESSLISTVQRLAELGLDEKEIAYALGITKLKLTELLEQKQIANAFAKGVQSKARKVEDALYRRAVGFEYEELVTAEKPPAVIKGDKVKVENGKSAKSSARTTLKTVIPDVAACIFWLKNRMPDKWKDPKDINNGKTSFADILKLYEEEQS